MISTREMLFFQADEKYTRVQTAQGEVLIRKTLKELADELDPMNSGASTAPRWCAWMPSRK
jgi:DNA-binding LytR/AlgR family response regulator